MIYDEFGKDEVLRDLRERQESARGEEWHILQDAIYSRQNAIRSSYFSGHWAKGRKEGAK